MAGPAGKSWSFNYDDLSKLTGREINTIQQAASRGTRGIASGFNPSDFRSVVLWVFRNATDELRVDIMAQMKFFRDAEDAKRILKKRKKKTDH